MYYGVDAFKAYIDMYEAPYDDEDMAIIEGFLDGLFAFDDEGKISLLETVGEA